MPFKKKATDAVATKVATTRAVIPARARRPSSWMPSATIAAVSGNAPNIDTHPTTMTANPRVPRSKGSRSLADARLNTIIATRPIASAETVVSAALAFRIGDSAAHGKAMKRGG